MSTSESPSEPAPTGLQEQLIATILSSLVPANSLEKSKKQSHKGEPPSLNVATLTTNFRKFSSRIGVVFSAQHTVAQIYKWRNPRETMSFGMIWGLLCLQPHLVLALPFVVALLGLLVPSFLHLHPPPPSNIPLPPEVDAWSTKTGKAKKFGGTAEGRDFLLNMRDIQNSMDDYTKLYDRVSKTVTDYANFADEKKSSVVLTICVFGCVISALGATYFPIRYLVLALGWLVLFSGHPASATIDFEVPPALRIWLNELTQEIRQVTDATYIDPGTMPDFRTVVVYEYRNGNGQPFYSGFGSIGNAGSEDEYITNNIEAVLAPPGFAFVESSKWTVVVEIGPDNSRNLSRTTLKRKVIRQL